MTGLFERFRPARGGVPRRRAFPLHAGGQQVLVDAPGTLTRLAGALDHRYVIDREVGAGSTAVVFRATDRRYQRSVALKVLRRDRPAGLGRRRFLREIRLAAQLTHPHILPILDSGEVGDLLYYVMPFAEGGSLRARLEEAGALAMREVHRILRDVVSALDYAHRHQVVHRDVKPGNILFHEGVAMLADFGIGKALSGTTLEDLSHHGSVVGTVPYMSPEQISGNEAIDGRSDLFGLGCVFYEMVTGMPAFSGPTPGAVLARRVSTPMPELTFPDTVPAKERHAIRALMAFAPSERPSSGADLLEMLNGAEPCSCGACGPDDPDGEPPR